MKKQLRLPQLCSRVQESRLEADWPEFSVKGLLLQRAGPSFEMVGSACSFGYWGSSGLQATGRELVMASGFVPVIQGVLDGDYAGNVQGVGFWGLVVPRV